MSGNYDYPPASRRPSRGGTPSERSQRPSPTRANHLRDFLRSEPNRGFNARAIEILDREEYFWAARGYGQSSFELARAAVDSQFQLLQSDPSGRGERIRNLLRDSNSATVNPSEMNQEPSRPPDTSRQASSRPRPFRRRAMQDRSPRGTRPRETENNTLLDEPVPHLESPTVMPQGSESDRQMNRRRAKRRKLETDDAREGTRAFSYGQYGQVVPGTLRMEMASCDGGTFDPDGQSSFPENILRNDSSVYCTKSDRCNVVLKHLGGAPFCLKRIVIKAPKIGYDSPIQQGMVFVSMTSDELLARTAQDQIHYSAARRRRRNRRGGIMPFQEHLNAVRSPLQSLQGTLHASADPTSDSDNDHLAATFPDLAANFRVTTSYDDNSPPENDGLEDDDEVPSFTEIERLQTEHMEEDMACTDSDESDSDSAAELSTFNRRNRGLQTQLRALHRQYGRGPEHRGPQRRRQVTSLIEPSTRPVDPYSSDPNSQNSDSQLLRPHAQFFMERAQSIVNIKFDPPPSGRFILIKLWSPHNGGNIDIQSITAHGYAGPRFFPAGGFR